MDACMEVDGRVGERRGSIYNKKGYQHGQAIQLSLLSVIMLHDLRVTVCVCSEGNALLHIKGDLWKDYLYVSALNLSYYVTFW